MTSSKTQISLYKQSKEGLKSLFVQTTQVSIGLGLMLILTGGNPPGWLVSASFFVGIGFVAWSESKRQSELEKSKSTLSTELTKLINLDRYFQIAKLREGVTSWNQWREQNSQIRPNLRGAELNNAYLSYANLIRADLSYAKLSDTKLNYANLIRVNLGGADLSGANLAYAKLNHANLIRANLSFANLWIANLSCANLSGANLSGADLRGADLRGADLSNAEVENTQFGNNEGIDKELKNDLIDRGAKFTDAPGDTADVKSPVRR
jgi:uncharacterized protein YjbI with pentapeptide repeats